MNNSPFTRGNPTLKYCSGCDSVFPRNDTAFFKNRARADGLSVLCKKCHNSTTHEDQASKRDRVFALLGDKCVVCGFADKRALQIDHIHGSGRIDRGTDSPSKYYDRVVSEGSAKFQILCANCNVIKKIENREHARPATQFPDEVRVGSEQLTEIRKRIKGSQDYEAIGKKVRSWWTPERREERAAAMQKIRAEKKWRSR